MGKHITQSIRPALLLLFATCASPVSAAADTGPIIAELRRQLAERDAENARLRQELENLRRQEDVPPAAGARTDMLSTQATRRALAAATPSSPPQDATQASPNEEEMLATALESSLVRQGAAVLQPGTIAIEPELSYFYDETSAGRRRDAFATAISLRYGLPGLMQADVYIPYVLHDDQRGAGSTSGVGDIRLGLTKQITRDQDGLPTLLVHGSWRTTTGDLDRTPPTGFGQHGIQVGVTASKRMDPLLLLGSLSYSANLGSARLADGSRIEAGDTFGARLIANLAATPDVSVFWGASYNSGGADRFNNERIESTDRALGFVEFGGTAVIGRGRFFNVNIGLGVTPAAPRFSVTASLPFIF